jgi:hypothetical protein
MNMADKALLLGVNNYRHISDLRGCINDVHNVRALLSDVFEFNDDNIRMFTDADVVKENIRREWDWLYEDVQEGDRLVVHFSGHGSYTTDVDDDEPDGADELICLYDMDWDDDQTYLLDDELRELTSRVPAGANLTVIFDSCHSGTATRMTVAPDGRKTSLRPDKMPLVDVAASLARMTRKRGSRSTMMTESDATQTLGRILTPRNSSEDRDVVRVRFVEPPRKVLEALHRGGVRRGFRGQRNGRRRSAMKHVLLAGSKDTQTSADAYIEGDYHGAFTFYLCKIVENVGREADHQDVIRQVRSSLADQQFTQIPQLEPELTSGPLFGPSQRVSSTNHATKADSLDGQVAREIVSLLRDIRAMLATPSRVPYSRQAR